MNDYFCKVIISDEKTYMSLSITLIIIIATVLVSIQDWERLQHSAGTSLQALLLSDEGRTGDLLRQRGALRRRAARK